MRAILEQHAERLTADERRAMWGRVSGARHVVAAPHPGRPARVAAMAAAAVVAIALVLWQRPPSRLRSVASPTRAGAPSSVAGPTRVRETPGGASPSEREAAARVRVVSRPAPAPGEGALPSAAIARVTELPQLVRSHTGVTAAPPARWSASAPAGAGIGGPGTLTGRVVDARTGQPLPFASVALPQVRRGALTDTAGRYRIDHVPPGTYSLDVRSLGYRPAALDSVRLSGPPVALHDIAMNEVVVLQEHAIEVTGIKPIDTKSTTTRQSISADQLRSIPVDNLREAVRTKAGVVAQGGELHFRGGSGGAVGQSLGGMAISPPPPVIPTTGGTRLPNDEAFDSMFFRDHGVNPFIATDEDALSTFAVDVDAASYTVTRRYLELGHLPPADAVRVEEFVNFFPQGYPRFEHEDFRLMIDGAPSPFGPGYHLLRIGIKGREIVDRDRKPAQLTFVIDVSGSMAREDRLELVKRALRLLVDRLRGDDRVGIVVYGSEGRVALEPLALGGSSARGAGIATHSDAREEDHPVAGGAGRKRILEAIERLGPEGSTNAEHGLRLGYEMARRAFRPEAINRIVLCSDGVANVGRTGPESILGQVRTDADRGIHLTTIGFGMGNYNDVLMEQLADKGDGNHYYVDDLDEARRVFVENLTGTLQTIAKDAKVQVEFDSTRVLRYRLLGFENRDVADRDFRNDKVDAGEIGAGHEVTALYEVKLAPGVTRGTLATVRFRYARPEQEGAGAPQVRELEQRFDVATLGRRFEDAAPRFRLDAAVAEFAEILRGSYWAREGRLSDVLSVARSAARGLRDDPGAEFVTLVEKAAALSSRAKAGERGEGR